MGIIRIFALLLILLGLSWYAGGPDALKGSLLLACAIVVIPVLIGFLFGYFGETTAVNRPKRSEFKSSLIHVGALIFLFGYISLALAMSFRFFLR